MDEDRDRCPIHLGFLCFRDRPPLSHNIRLRAGELTYRTPKRDHEFIYRIAHARTGMCYIGRTTKSLSQRWQGHRSARKLEARANHPLYHAMNEQGLQMFIMEELEECGRSVARERELDCMRQFESWNPQKGYNEPIAEIIYARDLYLLLNPGKRPRYEELRDSLHALHCGLRESSPGDQELQQELQKTEDTFLREGRILMKRIPSLTSPVIYDGV